jgi:uncharacterized protein YkwD
MRMRGSGRIAGVLLVLSVVLLTSGSTAPVATAKGGGCSLGDKAPWRISQGQARKAVVCLINKKRAKYGRGPLQRNRQLQRAAQRHTNRMEQSGCFSHQCAGEGSLDARLRSTGYLSGSMGSWAYSENIGWGKKRRATPSKIVDAWMKSPPHRANILSGNFKQLGVGMAKGTPQKQNAKGAIYTVDFGRRT